MSRFELVRFGCGALGQCQLTCGGPNSCKAKASGALKDAILKAREIIGSDPLDVVEVRQGGKLVCTVGATWMSHVAS
jgi:hypothetical protein